MGSGGWNPYCNYDRALRTFDWTLGVQFFYAYYSSYQCWTYTSITTRTSGMPDAWFDSKILLKKFFN